MSLLYKALNQATQLREKAAARPDPGAAPAAPAGMAPTPPVPGLGLAVPVTGAGGGVSRWLLLGLIGITLVVSAGLLLLPEAPPLVLAPPQVSEVTAPQGEAPELEINREIVTSPPLQDVAPEPPVAESPPAEIQLPETAAPPAGTAPRIEIASGPPESALMRAPKHVADAGIEKFTDGQIAWRETAALGPPIDLNRGGEEYDSYDTPPMRPGMQITDDTDQMRARYEQAANLLNSGEPVQAERIYAQILRDDPIDRIGLLGRAASLQKMQRPLLAVAAYEAVLAAYPGDEWALINLLGLLSAQNSTPALAQLERLIRINPENALIPAQAGMLYLARGEYEPAARHLTRAVEIAPRNAKYVFNLAVVYDKWGQAAPALRFYAQSLDLAARSEDMQIPVDSVRQRMAFLTVR